MKDNLDSRLKYLKQQAKKRGLKVSVDKRLDKTPYRAAHPLSNKYVDDIVVKKKSITVAPFVARNKKKMVMDVNHELIEYKLACNGVGYKKAHTIANRKQRGIFRSDYKDRC
jgi:uncharacterized protein (DUF2461 family)